MIYRTVAEIVKNTMQKWTAVKGAEVQRFSEAQFFGNESAFRAAMRRSCRRRRCSRSSPEGKNESACDGVCVDIDDALTASTRLNWAPTTSPPSAIKRE